MLLYNFDQSPNPLKVRVALAEMGQKYENKEIVLFKGEQRSNDFMAINPLGKVPVLVDDDLTLTESNAILCYLAQNYGKDLWPADAKLQAKAYQWMSYEANHMNSCFGTVWFNKFGMPKVGGETKPEEEIQDQVDDASGALDHLEDHFTDNEYILGDQFSVADCCIGVQLASLKQTLLADEKVWPAVSEYLNRFLSRPSWKAANGPAIWD